MTMKKVSFANDTKSFDGTSYLTLEYAKMCARFFKKDSSFGKIRTENDILKFTQDINVIRHCLRELKVIKEKLLKNKTKNNFKDIHLKLMKCIKFNNDKFEYDSIWDHFFYLNRTLKYQQKKICVPLIRNGSNIKFAKNMFLSHEHIPYVEYLITISFRAHLIFFEKNF